MWDQPVIEESYCVCVCVCVIPLLAGANQHILSLHLSGSLTQWCLWLKGILHLWKDNCVFKMGHLCRRNVKLFLNLELS